MPYAGRRIALTTLHGKQKALAKPFALGLGANLELIACDTNALGTFSGEVARIDDALSTCQRKAWMGMKQSGLPLGLASEASFGPHPSLPLLAVGQEVLVFVDRERRLTVVERQLEWRTNYAQTLLEPGDDPSAWLRQVRFPSHGVMARPAAADGPWWKDLCSPARLQAALTACRATDPDGRVRLETDMRAHRNPTRMRSIRRLAVALVRRLATACPHCDAPGWGLIDTVPGLPCSLCGTATELTASEIWGCQACGHRQIDQRRDGLIAAEPGQCPWCNP
jgi:hypothetical protein